jgi:FLVCR family MFS transporter 7
MPFVPLGIRFPVGITGQAIAAIAYPFIMFLPTKVAAAWFPDNQRGMATTIGLMSNPLGVLIANVISPQLVRHPDDVLLLNVLIAVPSILVLIVALFAITRSEPKLPPTVSASQKQSGFVEGIKTCFTSKEYLILLLVMGGGIGLFNCLYTVMQQLLCPSGYDNTFSGIAAALMIVGGICGAAASGVFVDRTKRYEETMKVCMGLAVVFGIVFLQLTLHRELGAVILFTCFGFGILGLATYPVGLEMAAECTFPVSETTSTGLIVLSGQIQSIIYVALLATYAKPLQPEALKYQVCSQSIEDADSVSAKDMSTSVIIMSVIAAVLVLVLVAFFHPRYRRLEADKNNMISSTKTGNTIEETNDTNDNENGL